MTVSYESGRLVLTGRLPSFYLKQVLQTLLEDLPGVTEIDNRMQVVCSSGLSSIGCDDLRYAEDDDHAHPSS